MFKRLTKLFYFRFTSIFILLFIFSANANAINIKDSQTSTVSHFSTSGSAVSSCVTDFSTNCPGFHPSTYSSTCNRFIADGGAYPEFPTHEFSYKYSCSIFVFRDAAGDNHYEGFDGKFLVHGCQQVDEQTGACEEDTYTIILSQVTAKPSIHGNYITDIYPAKNFINNSEPNANPIITLDELVATVYDESGQKVNNVDILVEIEPIESTAGHFEHGVRPKKVSTYGQLVTTTSLGFQLDGNTGTNGFKFRYLSSELSGDYNMKVTCKDKVCNQSQPSKVWVGVENLIPLEKIASLYKFVGDKPTHPDNHYVTEKTRVKMITLAAKYKTKFPNNTVIHYNDSSLERGGLFDVGKVKWKPPHSRHRVGTDVDVRANEASGNIPSKDDAEFVRLARKSGCLARLEYSGTTNEHFHLYCERRFD